MFHGITAEVLYCVSRITSVFTDPLGTEIKKEGTSFSLNDVKGRDAIVTNAHMLDLNYGQKDSKYKDFRWTGSMLERIGKDADGLPNKPMKFWVPATHNSVLRHSNAENDVAVIFAPQVMNLDRSVNRSVDYCVSLNDVASAEELYRDLLPFDTIAFPGFPPWYSKDGPRAIIRGGSIASDPRYPYRHTGIENQDVLLYEAFSFGGSSGSPVFAIPKVPPVNVNPNTENRFRRLLVVGVNAGHLNDKSGVVDQHSGLSYLVKSNVIHEIIGQIKI